jgi:hypothetical protein
VNPRTLDEEQVRDQVAAAEELAWGGLGLPAAVLAGAAIEGMLRLRVGDDMPATASAGELLEELWHEGAVAELEQERLRRILAARDLLSHGFLPNDAASAAPERVQAALDITVRLMEDLPRAAEAAEAGEETLQ